MSRAPDFLVIGAQKCGTTTLFEDLRAHPHVHLLPKEASALVTASDSGSYRRRFTGTDGLVGEVSTQYSMKPDVDVAGVAAEWAPEARIVYIVREPIARVVSHHHHDFALGLVGPDVDRAVLEHPSLVQNSRYATQLRPWLRAFTRERVHVIRFEDYVAARESEVARLCLFLGLEPHVFDSSLVANAAGGKVVATGRWDRLSRNRAYRALARPLMSERARRSLMSRVLPSAPPRPDPPSRTTLDHLVEELRPEVEDLAEMLGTQPWWDLGCAADEIAGSARGHG